MYEHDVQPNKFMRRRRLRSNLQSGLKQTLMENRLVRNSTLHPPDTLILFVALYNCVWVVGAEKHTK